MTQSVLATFAPAQSIQSNEIGVRPAESSKTHHFSEGSVISSLQTPNIAPFRMGIVDIFLI